MSFENNSSRYPEISGELSMRERILVQSATIIDECSRTEKHRHGRLFLSDWKDLDNLVNYQLAALGKHPSPEGRKGIDFSYALVGYNIKTETYTTRFEYSTNSPEFLKLNKRNEYQRCRSKDLDTILKYLSTAPTSQANEQFIAMMHANEIRDDRLSTQFKRRVRKLGRTTFKKDF